MISFINSRFNSPRFLPRSIRAMRVVSIAGIAIAVAALIVANAIGRGFEKNYRRALMDFNAHLVVMAEGGSADSQEMEKTIAGIREKFSIRGTTPFFYREALAIGGGNIRGIVVKGVDPGTLRDVNSMSIELSNGVSSLGDALRPSGANDIPVIIGKALAQNLGIAEGGAKFKMLIPREGDDRKKIRRFDEVRVAGFFESGLNDYDAEFVLISLPSAWQLFGMEKGAITGIELKISDPEKAESTASAIRKSLAPYYGAISWDELNEDLISAVRLEKLVSGVIMGVMMVVALLNIVAVLVLTAIHRARELSILKAIGFKDSSVVFLLVRGGSAIGARGVAIGLVIGIAVSWAIERFNLVPLDPEIYLIDTLPIDISWAVCGLIGLLCFAAGLLTSAIVAKNLTNLPVAEGLRMAR